MIQLTQLPYDLIITDFMVESVKEGVPVYTFDQLPSPYELQLLCRDIRLKKHGYNLGSGTKKGYTDILEFQRLLSIYS